MAVWDDSVSVKWDPPVWLLTGHMLLWSDGSPAHVDMSPFEQVDAGWQAELMISRSELKGTRWLMLRMFLAHDVRKEWESHGTSARARALQALAIYLKLTDWYKEDLGVLELK